jgi:hypothetical protein
VGKTGAEAKDMVAKGGESLVKTMPDASPSSSANMVIVSTSLRRVVTTNFPGWNEQLTGATA